MKSLNNKIKMEEIGGRTDKKQNCCGNDSFSANHLFFTYCNQLLDSNICSYITCSLLKLYENAQIIYIAYVFFELKSRQNIFEESEIGTIFHARMFYENIGISWIFLVFLSIFLISIFIIPIGLLTQLLVLRFDKNKFLQKIHSAISTSACLIIIFITSGLAIPSMITLFLPLNCEDYKSILADAFLCWSPGHIIILTINCLAILILVSIFIISAWFLWDDYFHSAFPYAGPESYTRIIGIIDKICIAAGCVFDPKGNSIIGWFAVILLVHIFQVYTHLTNPPMFSYAFQNVLIFCESNIVPYVVLLFLNNNFLEIELEGFSIFILLMTCIAFSLIIIMLRYNFNINQAYTKSDQGRNTDAWLLYIQRLIYLFNSQKDSEYDRIQFVGLLSSFQEDCKDDECKCNTVELIQNSRINNASHNIIQNGDDKRSVNSYNNFTSDDIHRPKSELYAKVIHEIIKSALRQFPRSINLILVESYFLKGVLGNPYKSAYGLASAKNQRPNLLNNFAIFRYTKLIENDVKSENSVNYKDSNMSVEITVEMERTYYLFRKLMEETAVAVVEFLNSVKEEKINGEKMETLGSKIGLQNREISKIFYSFVKKYSFHHKILIDYAKYLHFVLNCENESAQLFGKAQDIVKRMHEEKLITSNAIDLCDLSKNSKVSVIVVSANAGKMGAILNCNSEVTEIFGQIPRHLVNLNVSSLIPDYFSRPHMALVENYINEFNKDKIQQIQNSQKPNAISLCVNSQGYLIPVKLQYKLYPNLDKGLLFVTFVQKIEKIVPLLPIKGFIKEENIGIITCSNDGTLLGITESIERIYKIPIGILKASLKNDSVIDHKILITDIIQGISLADYRTVTNPIQRVYIKNGKVRDFKDDDEIIELEGDDKIQTNIEGDKFEALGIVENKIYQGFSVYQIILILQNRRNNAKAELYMDFQQSVKRPFDEKMEEIIEKDKTPTYNLREVTDNENNTENDNTNPDSNKKYSPLIKSIKDSVKKHKSSKVKLVFRVGFSLAIILVAMNTAVMLITQNSINLSKDRVIYIHEAWNRVVELANINMYLVSLSSIARREEPDSIHTDGKDKLRFESVKNLYVKSLENLRQINIKIKLADTTFSKALQEFAYAKKTIAVSYSIYGKVLREAFTFSIGLAELAACGVQFVSFNETDYLTQLRSTNYYDFRNNQLEVSERYYFYVRYNTINYFRNQSVKFAETLMEYSALAADEQMLTIASVSSCSLVLVLLAGCAMIYIIVNIKSTRLIVLAFYAQIPKQVISHMSENAGYFLNEIEDTENLEKSKTMLKTPLPKINVSVVDSFKNPITNSGSRIPKSDENSVNPNNLSILNESKIEDSRIELVAPQNKPLENPAEPIPEQNPENEQDEHYTLKDDSPKNKIEQDDSEDKDSENKSNNQKKEYEDETLNSIVKQRFTASIRSQRLDIVCLVFIFFMLFGVYIVFNIGLYWQTSKISNESFSYMDTYLSLHSSVTFSMALYDNFIITLEPQKTYDHPDAIFFYTQRAKEKLLESMNLKKETDSWLIGQVVRLQNRLDTPEGICEMYKEEGMNANICKDDYNRIMAIGMTSLISRTLDEINSQYEKFLYNPGSFDLKDVKTRFVDLLRIKEEYLNRATNKVRETLKSELNAYFNVLDAIAKSVYSGWVVIMATVYFFYVRYLSNSLNNDIIKSNNILNMLPVDYLLTVIKDKFGFALVKKIFL